MKTYRSLPNNSNGIFPVSFSVHPPFILRSSSVRAPFKLRSSSVRAPFKLRSSSVRAPFKLRSSSVHPPFELRSFSVQSPFGNRKSIEEWSKKYRRIIGGKTEMYRNSNGKLRERRPEQKLYFCVKWHFEICMPLRYKKYFFPINTGGVSRFWHFETPQNCQKNWNPLFRVVTLYSQAC